MLISCTDRILVFVFVLWNKHVSLFLMDTKYDVLEEFKRGRNGTDGNGAYVVLKNP